MKPQQQQKKAASGLAARQEMAVRYRECRRNYAASLGGYMVDGCREFKPARPQGMADSFRCATCGCHRSFHKREVEPEPAYDYFSDSTCTE